MFAALRCMLRVAMLHAYALHAAELRYFLVVNKFYILDRFAVGPLRCRIVALSEVRRRNWRGSCFKVLYRYLFNSA